MIPILYNERETNFTSFGIGALADCVSCEVTEERNGVYECKFKYPVSGALYAEIKKQRIIKAKPNDKSAGQAFRIYRITVPLDGIITVYAQHISYDLGSIGVTPFTLSSATPTQAIDAVFAHAALPHNFTFRTDYSATKDFSVIKPKSIRACLGGTEGSILNQWGGEFEWDNFRIIHHHGRGNNNGVVIEYGKNLTKLEQDSDTSSVFTDLLPYAVNKTDDGDEVVTLPEVTLPIATTLETRKTVIRDFTDSFEIGDYITADMLRTKAQEYIENNPLGVESPTITVSFEPLWKQPEYAAVLERVSLCDTVTVKHTTLGVKTKTKVIKTVYDTIAEKYISVTLGSCKANLADRMTSIAEEVQSTQKQVDRFPLLMKSAITNASKLITGQTGGYVVLNGNESGQPFELLVMDAPRIEDAVNVWRWNAGGLGFSSNGYNGEYGTAITADGSIVADFITAGSLVANIIKAGVLSSQDGSSYWNLETGEVVLRSYATTTKVEQIENNVTSLSGTVSGLSDDIDDLSDDIDGLGTDIGNLSDEVDGISGNVTSLSGNVTSLTGDVNTLSGNVSSLSGTVSGLSGDVNNLASDVSGLTSDVNTLSGNVGTLTTNVSTLTTKQATLETNVSGLTSSVSSLTTRVTTAEGTLVSVQSDISTLQQTDSEISASVAKKVDETYGSSTSTFGRSLKSTGFYVYSNASTVMKVTSSGLEISGKITSTSGKIGGFTLSTYYIYGGTLGTSNCVMIGVNYSTARSIAGSGSISTWGLILGTNFGVTRAGALYCKGAHISGAITATSGTFTNCTIGESCVLYGDLINSGTETVYPEGIQATVTYNSTMRGNGMVSNLTVSDVEGRNHTAVSYIKSYGSIIVPDTYSSVCNDGMMFGIAKSNNFSFMNLLCGVSFCHRYDTTNGLLSTVHMMCGSDGFLEVSVFGVDNGICAIGNSAWTNSLRGSWTINGTNSQIARVLRDSTYYGILSGTWYCDTLRSGTSSGYNIRLDSDQVTFYYGTKEVGDIEAYSTYVDLQGTFKTNGSNWISTSDERVKNSIEDYTADYDILFDNLRPRRFKFNAGNSGRYHTGFIVQEVLLALETANVDTTDFAAVVHFAGDEEKGVSESWGLRYEELISLNTWQIQKLKARVAELEKLLNLEEKQNETLRSA